MTLTHADFISQTAYVVTVNTADDLAGNPLSGASYTWSFSTGPSTPTSYVYLPVVLRNY